MSEVMRLVEDDAARVSCDNCDWTGTAEDLEMISDFEERVSAGFTCPAGQCPECGALAYLVKKEEPSAAHLERAAPEMFAALAAAVARVEIANAEGNPILSAWLPDARAALAHLEREEPAVATAPRRLFVLAGADHDGDVTGCHAFSTHEKATAALRDILADDWKAHTPEDENDNPEDMPEDIDAAQTRLAEWRELNPWTIHTVDVDTGIDANGRAAQSAAGIQPPAPAPISAAQAHTAAAELYKALELATSALAVCWNHAPEEQRAVIGQWFQEARTALNEARKALDAPRTLTPQQITAEAVANFRADPRA